MHNVNPFRNLNNVAMSCKIDAYSKIASTRAVYTGVALALASIQTLEELGPYRETPSLEHELLATEAGTALQSLNQPLHEMHKRIAMLENCGVHTSSARWCGFNWGVLIFNRPTLLADEFKPYTKLYKIPAFSYDEGHIINLEALR